MITEMDASEIMNSSESPCNLGPPPDMILHLPPPPFPNFLPYKTEPYSNVDVLTFIPHLNNSPCKHLCDWKSEGVQYIEMPQQGNGLDNTWLLVLISFCIGVIFIGIILAMLFLKCKITNCGNGDGKTGVLSVPTANSGITTKCGRIENDTILYPCATETLQDGRVMWATLTPRGTTCHYLEDHTYEAISNGNFHKRLNISTPTEHTYTEPPVIQSPVTSSPKTDKAFDNTAFVDYEEPLSLESEYYQVEDTLDIHEMGGFGIQTLRPPLRVSSPTRIEHPNLPPLNLHPHKTAYRKISTNQRASDTILRSGVASSTYVPTI